MRSVAVPLQAWGLGDIIFTQTILKDLRDIGFPTVWPVKPEFIEGLQRAYPDVHFIPESMIRKEWMDRKRYEAVDGVIVLPIRWAESILGREYKYHMKSKYDLCEMDWKLWKRDAMPVRDLEKETMLRKALKIEEGEQYNFVQTVFGSNAQGGASVKVDNGLRNVQLQLIDGFSLFDWCSVMENATTIHAVSSSSLYLFELLELKAQEIHLYVRKPYEKNFEYVEFLFTKNYIQHL